MASARPSMSGSIPAARCPTPIAGAVASAVSFARSRLSRRRPLDDDRSINHNGRGWSTERLTGFGLNRPPLDAGFLVKPAFFISFEQADGVAEGNGASRDRYGSAAA